MNTTSVIPTGRTLLGETLHSERFSRFMDAIQQTAERMRLDSDVLLGETVGYLSFSNGYGIEVGMIKVVHIANFCGCGKDAVSLQADEDTAWLLWARS